jgi:hypothetical protein
VEHDDILESEVGVHQCDDADFDEFYDLGESNLDYFEKIKQKKIVLLCR